jgi:hypothetical protein
MYISTTYDDFKNDPDIQKIRKQLAEYLLTIKECTSLVKTAFTAKKSSRKNLKGFLLYQSIDKPRVIESFAGQWNNKNIYISTIEYYTSVQAGRVRSAGNDHYLLGVVTLTHKYPHVIIQPEILKLKIENLVTKMDVDFRHARWFSFLFYVVTKDKALLKDIFEMKELNRLTKFIDAEIEIIGTQCFFRVSRTAISSKETKKFIELGKILAEVF